MEIRTACSANETKQMDTEGLRANYLVSNLMQPDVIRLCYTHYDRLITGGIMPVDTTIALHDEPELKSSFFLERREMGIINVGGPGLITANGNQYPINKLDALYLGKGTDGVEFSSLTPADPAAFYLLSAPAHQQFPVSFLPKEKAIPVELGTAETANKRTIYKYIHLGGIKSCQLVMGLTLLAPGSVWNTMPCHTHSRRTELYFYFNLAGDQRIMHLMGEPQETRHLIAANYDAVISPPWSVHAGCGTSNYGFIWGMAGENLNYADMDAVPVNQLR
jgi:4-deoxy-L-threo-5-hexosulose-uronate ketol-isomerase